MAKLGAGVIKAREAPSITQDELQKIECAAGVKLLDDAHSSLEQALGLYVMLRGTEEGSFDSLRVQRSIVAIRRSASSMMRKFDKLQSCPEGRHTILTIFHQVPGSTHAMKEMGEFISYLRVLITACDDAARFVKESKFGTPGRSSELAAYEFLFNEAAKSFEKAGGTVAVYWMHNLGRNGSPFIDFLYALLLLAPPEHRPESEGALAERVDRWCSKRKSAGQ